MKLTMLRDIGWDLWDPVQLNGSAGGWRRSNAADEYDRYLLRAVDYVQNGKPDAAPVDYLVSIETEHMGLTDLPAARMRAQATVAAIRAHLDSVS